MIPSGSTLTPPPPPSPATLGRLRAALLSSDVQSVDVAVNGVVLFGGLTYPTVSTYAQLEPGEYRVQFLRAGEGSPALAETVLTLGSGQAYTVVATDHQAFSIRDDLATSSGRANLRLFNAVSDFPTPFDGAVINGAVLFRGVEYGQSSAYKDLIPGIYDLELRRSSTTEVLAISLGHNLTASANFTVFAIGNLRREEDIAMVVFPDGG